MPLTTVHDMARFLDAFAPPHLAESWDNVGLLVGDFGCRVERVMTCLTVTPESTAEAVADCADLIVTHHPFPFKPIKRLTGETREGRMLLDLIAAGVSIYSPHTAFDSALRGINQRLADGLGLLNPAPLTVRPETPGGPLEHSPVGVGRSGDLPEPLTLEQFALLAKHLLGVPHIKMIGPPGLVVRRAAVGCGSAGEFLDLASSSDCNVLLTGETSFHTCLLAQSLGLGLVLTGHYPSERFAVEYLSSTLSSSFPHLTIWPSRRERDPIQWL